MAREDRPILSNNADDDSFDERQDAERQGAERTPLLNGQHKSASRSKWAFWREFAVFVWAFAATVAVIVLAVLYQHQATSRAEPSEPVRPNPVKPAGKRNLVFMVSDGMGPASLSLTRSFRQHVGNLSVDDVLVLDQHLIGQSRTRSSSSLVTDSAAGATAFSCGKKSYNGAISMLPDHTPCGTVLEAAKKAGYTTGLVVTTRITDATPACFGSHANDRSEEDSIARQLIGEHPLGHVTDLIFGGGRCHFLPNGTEGSCRADDVDVVETARDKGYTYLETRRQFDRLKGGENVNLPVLGLFAPTDIPYEIDRRNMDDKYPSLEEMAITALKALSAATADSDQGFFLMIEGSRIDHAGHGNDPAAQVHEVLAYDKAFNAVLNFLNEDDTDGLLVATSDHETGGLAVARQLDSAWYPEYRWIPQVLANASHSAEYLADSISEYWRKNFFSEKKFEAFVRKQVREGLGITSVTREEIDELMSHRFRPTQAAYALADMISRRAQLGWSTHGHTAVDVNIYSSNPRLAAPLVGNHENTDVGRFLANFLGVDVDEVTKELQHKVSTFTFDSEDAEHASWLGKPAAAHKSTDRHHHGLEL